MKNHGNNVRYYLFLTLPPIKTKHSPSYFDENCFNTWWIAPVPILESFKKMGGETVNWID